jgi:NADH-quinone oxidoreductase subunit H
MTTALMTSAVPLGDRFSSLAGISSYRQLTLMLLYFIGVSIGVYGIMIGGWASNNKFSLVWCCSCRFSNDLLRGCHGAFIDSSMMTGTFKFREISLQQSGMNWNVFYQPLSFLIFLICALQKQIELHFDLAECETELIGGYHTVLLYENGFLFIC